jgi:hypothetical protein
MSEWKLPEPALPSLAWAKNISAENYYSAKQMQTLAAECYQAGLAARVPEYDKNELNAAVTELYDAKMRGGKHGHYETLFHCVHAAIRRVYAAPEAP